MKTRNSEVLASFVKYCEENPNMRFWQALKNWSEWAFIYVSPTHFTGGEKLMVGELEDTYNWEGKDK